MAAMIWSAIFSVMMLKTIVSPIFLIYDDFNRIEIRAKDKIFPNAMRNTHNPRETFKTLFP
jgi:hypothetical protein